MSLGNKTLLTRNYILDRLESGTLKGGDRLAGARELAEELGVSFLKVQQALEGLCRDGILRTVNRQGTFVQTSWRDCILPENVSVFSPHTSQPWLSGIKHILGQQIEDVRFTHAFPVGALELKTTLQVQEHASEYMDLSGLFHECYPDRSDFFDHPFAAGMVNGRLVGIPFIFSPRVVFYNPKLFSKFKCPLPRPGWSWDDFVATVRTLSKSLPPHEVINWHFQPFLWMNFVIRAGGTLIRPDAADPVEIDSPRTKLALRYFRDLGKILGGREIFGVEPNFISGRAAMVISERQLVSHMLHRRFDDWQTIALPAIPGGTNLTMQATDLLCVRKPCTNPELARLYIQAMLSPKVQDYIGKSKYGIPIRKSAALKSIAMNDPRDAVFAHELDHVASQYNLDSLDMAQTIIAGIQQILASESDIDKATAELASFARQYLAIRKPARLAPTSLALV